VEAEVSSEEIDYGGMSVASGELNDDSDRRAGQGGGEGKVAGAGVGTPAEGRPVGV
jgi:hypothetical protein